MQVTALAQADRHEAALVSNVIVPRDIGVTWSMIGGLKQAKELLRQSITYPLKFPHLYSEGIAQEVSETSVCCHCAVLATAPKSVSGTVSLMECSCSLSVLAR